MVEINPTGFPICGDKEHCVVLIFPLHIPPKNHEAMIIEPIPGPIRTPQSEYHVCFQLLSTIKPVMSNTINPL